MPLCKGIAEIYDILRYGNIPQSEIQNIFRELNTGLLKSFLLDITVDILGAKDTDGTDLLTKISDRAGSKWTGGWTVEAALKLGIPVPTIAESLFARWMSGRNHISHFLESEHKMKPSIIQYLLSFSTIHFLSCISVLIYRARSDRRNRKKNFNGELISVKFSVYGRRMYHS